MFQVFIFTIGLVGNSLCVLLFSLRCTRRNFHHLMMGLAVYDMIYLSCALILFTIPHMMPR